MRFSADAKPVTSFSVATSRKYKDKDETVWFKVTVWGNQAESCNQFLTKGSKVLVEGRLKPVSVFQKKDGTWDANLEVVADNVRFLSGKAEEEVAL